MPFFPLEGGGDSGEARRVGVVPLRRCVTTPTRAALCASLASPLQGEEN
jgi:hypothetical protein